MSPLNVNKFILKEISFKDMYVVDYTDFSLLKNVLSLLF